MKAKGDVEKRRTDPVETRRAKKSEKRKKLKEAEEKEEIAVENGKHPRKSEETESMENKVEHDTRIGPIRKKMKKQKQSKEMEENETGMSEETEGMENKLDLGKSNGPIGKKKKKKQKETEEKEEIEIGKGNRYGKSEEMENKENKIGPEHLDKNDDDDGPIGNKKKKQKKKRKQGDGGDEEDSTKKLKTEDATKAAEEGGKGSNESLEEEEKNDQRGAGEPLPKKKGKNKRKKKKRPTVSKSVDSQKVALEYLRLWDAEKGTWHFQKVRQVWLLQNMYDREKMPKPDFVILLRYLAGLRGNAKEVTIERAEKLILKLDEEMQKEDGGEGELEEADTLSKDLKIQWKRARDILQILS